MPFCSTNTVCTPPPTPPLPFSAVGSGLNLQPNFQKEGLDRTWTFREGLLGKTGDIFQGGGGGGCNFHIKNKLKSEIFNYKKSLQATIFFSVMTKNSNWDILSKNLVTFKR